MDVHTDMYDICMLTHEAHKMHSNANTRLYYTQHLFIFPSLHVFVFTNSRVFMFPSFLIFVFSGSESFDPFAALRKVIFDPPVSMNAIGECLYHQILFIIA